jgi:hypothetical protein
LEPNKSKRQKIAQPHCRGRSNALLTVVVLLVVLACITFFVMPEVDKTLSIWSDASVPQVEDEYRELDATSEAVNGQVTRSSTQAIGGTVQEAVDAINAVGGSVAFDDGDRLIQVTLSGPFVTDEVMPYLIGKIHLEGVILENTNVSDEGVACLAELTSLQRLSIRGRNVTDVGMGHLKNLTRMGSLAIECADVTDAGLVHLLGMSELRSLSLDNTQVGDEGLAQIVKLNKLIELSLFNTRVSDAGLKLLEGLQDLQRLNLQSTNVTISGKAQVEQSRSPAFILAY